MLCCDQGGSKRGTKRRLDEARSNESALEGSAAEGPAKIARGRFKVFQTLLARSVARTSEITFPLSQLRDMINSSMAPGEDHFTEQELRDLETLAAEQDEQTTVLIEYQTALLRLQASNKVLILEETQEVTIVQ
eukprot:s3456_g2.t1